MKSKPIYKIIFIAGLLLLLLPRISFSQVAFRKYKEGEVFYYKLTTEANRNGKLSTSIAVSKHVVIKEGDHFVEEVSWLRKTEINAKDTINDDKAATSVMPYKISLSKGQKILIPALKVSGMLGEITDLNTFYVAIAPALNAQQLTKTKTFISNNELRHGNFADSVMILFGKDCILTSQKLVGVTKEYSIVETSFFPPDSFCLEPLADTVARKIYDYPNNFQMIQKGNSDKVNFFWGVESFSIISKIDNKDGSLREAKMVNELKLRLRYNSSKDLKTYDIEMPISIKRYLKLQRLTTLE